MSDKKFYINENYFYLFKEKGEHGDYVVCNNKEYPNKLWFNRGGEESGNTEFELVCNNITVIHAETDNYDDCFKSPMRLIEELQAQNQKLIAALEFYANDDNYTDIYTMKYGNARVLLLDSDAERRPDEERIVFGKLARKTLAEIKKGDK